MFTLLSHIDAFGQPYTLNLEGRSSYQTKLGGVCSLLIYLAIAGFIVTRTMYMIAREEPRLYEIKQGLDLMAKEPEKYNFEKYGIQVGVEMGIIQYFESESGFKF
jgi:hypothetical protein